MFFLTDLWRYAVVLTCSAIALCLCLQELARQWPALVDMAADVVRVLT